MCLSKKEHEILLSRMDRDNRNLKTLTQDSLDLEPARISRRKGSEPFRKIRDCAKSLHRALRHGWSCACDSPHSANLQLEMRDSESTPSFRILFPSVETMSLDSTNMMSWHETEFRLVSDKAQQSHNPELHKVDAKSTTHLSLLPTAESESHVAMMSSITQSSVGVPLVNHNKKSFGFGTKSVLSKKVGWAAETRNSERIPDNPVQNLTSNALLPSSFDDQSPLIEPGANNIENLCYALKKLHSTDRHNTCLGCLHDENHPLEVYTISQQPGLQGTCLTSLHEILIGDSGAMRDGAKFASRRCMTKRQRLQTAVILASTTLQLQTTEWFDSNWGRGDILFRNGLPELPYVSKILPKDLPEIKISVNSEKKISCGPIRNESLFNLGVLLLELSYGQPLGHFKSPEDPPIFTEYAIAKRLVEELVEEEASGYVDAARACIFCDFGPKVRNPSLNDQVFRQAVYDDVVVPLEEEWRHWNGRSV